MPTTRDAAHAFSSRRARSCPGKAANAGGVATSALEMSQNSMRLSWSFDEVDRRLKGVMADIYGQMSDAAATTAIQTISSWAPTSPAFSVADAMDRAGRGVAFPAPAPFFRTGLPAAQAKNRPPHKRADFSFIIARLDRRARGDHP